MANFMRLLLDTNNESCGGDTKSDNKDAGHLRFKSEVPLQQQEKVVP